MLDVDHSPSLGSRKARLVLIEFSDYQCGFCALFARQTFPRLEKEYIATGKIRYVARDFPLLQIHGEAFLAAEAAHCSRDQGRFWEMHASLFRHQRALDPAHLANYAKEIGLDVGRFGHCLESESHSRDILADLQWGEQIGISGTPHFFFGYAEPDASQVRLIAQMSGAQPYPVFRRAIESLLARQKQN